MAVNQGCRVNRVVYESLQTFFTFNEKRQQFSSRQKEMRERTWPAPEDECSGGKERKRRGQEVGKKMG